MCNGKAGRDRIAMDSIGGERQVRHGPGRTGLAPSGWGWQVAKGKHWRGRDRLGRRRMEWCEQERS